MNKAIIKTYTVTLPIGTTAGLRAYSFDLPSDYSRMAGFFVQRNLPATNGDYLKITVKDSTGVNVVDPVNIAFLNGTSAQATSGLIKIEDKFFRRVPFKASGTKMVLNVENFATTTVAQEFDFVYECDNEPLQ